MTASLLHPSPLKMTYGMPSLQYRPDPPIPEVQDGGYDFLLEHLCVFLLGGDVRLRNGRTRDNIMKLIQQNQLPAVMRLAPNRLPSLVVHRRKCHRIPELRLAVQNFRLPVMTLVPPMRCIGAAMKLKIQIPAPFRRSSAVFPRSRGKLVPYCTCWPVAPP